MLRPVRPEMGEGLCHSLQVARRSLAAVKSQDAENSAHAKDATIGQPFMPWAKIRL